MTRAIVIVGASVAGVAVTEALRRGGWAGPLVMIDGEQELPYDKPPLSKEVLVSEDGNVTALRLMDSVAVSELDLDLRLGLMARGLDSGHREVLTDDGGLPFSRLVIATGARPRRLPAFEGLAGVHYLRTLADAMNLRSALSVSSRIVIIGGGFIGAEIAAAACRLGREVTLVEAAAGLMARTLPAPVGSELAELHSSQGVRVLCGTVVAGPIGQDRVEGVLLADGSTLPGDLIVIGVGSVPNIDWLADSGLPLGDGVICDEALQVVGYPGIFAIGDVASWTSPSRPGVAIRAEHWTAARAQGRFVAKTILGKQAGAFEDVPYVWSDQHGHTIQHVGAFDPALVDVSAELTERGRLFRYRFHEELVGATAVDSPAEISAVRRELSLRRARAAS